MAPRNTSTASWRSASPPRPRAAVTAAIAAAGSGERLGAGGPKAFVPLGGRPLVEWSLDAFRAAAPVRAIVLAAPLGHEHAFDSTEDLVVVDGGATRAESVANALAAVETELVAIHDAARPLLTAALVEALVDGLERDPGASAVIAAAPVTDTVKRADPSCGSFGSSGRTKEPRVLETLDRSELWAAQTPQVFRTEALREALAASLDPSAATDEAMLIEAAGGTVLLHAVTEPNLKVTTPHDLRIAELLLAQSRIST